MTRHLKGRQICVLGPSGLLRLVQLARINSLVSPNGSLFNGPFFNPFPPSRTLIRLLRATCQVVQSLQVGALGLVPQRSNYLAFVWSVLSTVLTSLPLSFFLFSDRFCRIRWHPLWL